MGRLPIPGRLYHRICLRTGWHFTIQLSAYRDGNHGLALTFGNDHRPPVCHRGGSTTNSGQDCGHFRPIGTGLCIRRLLHSRDDHRSVRYQRLDFCRRRGAVSDRLYLCYPASRGHYRRHHVSPSPTFLQLHSCSTIPYQHLGLRRCGISMWAIIYPVCALPLMLALAVTGRRARKAGVLAKYKSPFQLMGAKKLSVSLFWSLDVIGIILLIAVFALILVPLTIAGGISTQWREAHVIAPLVVGILCIPAFIFWELRAPHPLIPFHLLKDRAVWGALGIACTLNFTWYLQGDYLYTVLIVAFNFSIKAATRVSSLYSFTSVLTGFALGMIVYKVRRPKWFIVAGTCLFMVAFGLLIRYRGSPSSSGQSGVIGAQVLLGFAGGMFPYPAQASIQAATKHEHVAVITGLYLATYNIGSAFGNCVSGAIWTQVLPSTLENRLADFGNSTLAAATYANPFGIIAEYPVGTPVRSAIIDAYQHVQRLLCITGICLVVLLIGFALCLRDPKLGNEQSLPDAEENVRR